MDERMRFVARLLEGERINTLLDIQGDDPLTLRDRAIMLENFHPIPKNLPTSRQLFVALGP